MIDTIKILGALLGGGNMSSGSGMEVLKTVLDAVSSSQSGTAKEEKADSKSTGGGLEDLLGSVFKGGKGSSNSGSMLGDIVGGLLGGVQTKGGRPKGGRKSKSRSNQINLNDLLGSVLGGGKTASGGAVDLGSLLESALKQFGYSEKASQERIQPLKFEEHSPDMQHSKASEQAEVMIRAMIYAAKSDGRIDQKEQEKILGRLGSISQEEIDYVNSELANPIDIKGFTDSVPKGLENQTYVMSLMAIDLDSAKEAEYLRQLAEELNISRHTSEQIHTKLGVPQLYT